MLLLDAGRKLGIPHQNASGSPIRLHSCKAASSSALLTCSALPFTPISFGTSNVKPHVMAAAAAATPLCRTVPLGRLIACSKACRLRDRTASSKWCAACN